MFERDKYFYKYPPDFEMSKKHRKASRIFKKYSQKASAVDCQCCDKRVGDEEAQDVSIFFDPMKLAFLGPGLPLFFAFIKNSFFLTFTFAIIYGAFSLFSNKVTGDCIQNQHCYDNFIDSFSILNKQNSILSLELQMCFMLTFSVVSVFVLEFLRKQINQINEKCDFLIDSPSDYSILIRRLPSNVTEQDIIDMIDKVRDNMTEDALQRTSNLQINHIVLSYCMKSYRKTKQKNMQNFKKSIDENTYQNFSPQPFEEFKDSGDACIVVFQSQQSKNYFQYQPTLYQSLLQCLWSPCIPESNFQVKGEKVSVERAPQPDDILWENGNVQIDQAVKRKTLFNLYAFGLLILGCGIQFGLAIAQQNTSQSMKTFLGIISSVLISFSNFGILEFLRYSSSREKNLTHTQYNSVLMVKISLLQFLNAGVFLLISKYLASSESFELTDNLIFQIHTIMILNALSHNLCVIILDYFQIIKKIYLYLGQKGIFKFTQLETNLLYQQPLPDMPYKYAYILKTLWLTGFYSSFVPFCVFYTFLGLILNYFVEKKLFSKTYSAPQMFSSALNQNAIKLMEFFPLSITFGGMIVFIYYSKSTTGLCFIYFICSLIISLGIIVFPFQKLTRKIFQTNKQKPYYFDFYSSQQKNFEITYKMSNPAYNENKKRKKVQRSKKKVFIGDFNQLEFELKDIIDNSYKKPLEKVISEYEEQKLRNEEIYEQKYREEEERKRLEEDMYDVLTKNRIFGQKQQILKPKKYTDLRRMLHHISIYDPIQPIDKNDTVRYCDNHFKNFVQDNDRIRMFVGDRFRKKITIKEPLLADLQLQKMEKQI